MSAAQPVENENLVKHVGIEQELPASIPAEEFEPASPLPWAYDEDGRIVSLPYASVWEVETGPDYPDYPLPDPTVAFVTPAPNGAGPGDKDARAIVWACNSVPLLQQRIRELEAALKEALEGWEMRESDFLAERGVYRACDARICELQAVLATSTESANPDRDRRRVGLSSR